MFKPIEIKNTLTMALDKMTKLFAIFLNSQQKYTMFVGTHLKSLNKMLPLYIG